MLILKCDQLASLILAVSRALQYYIITTQHVPKFRVLESCVKSRCPNSFIQCD